MTKRFEEFEVYQKSLSLAVDVFNLLKNDSFKTEFQFNNQLKRAVISISNNIAEGSEYNNNKQFVRFLRIAKGSTAEVRSMLILAEKLNLVEEEITKGLKLKSEEISKQLSKFIDYLKNNNL